MPVDSSNVEQLRAWDGDEGEYWADNAEYFDRSVAAYHERLLDGRPRSASDEHVLDVGCGTGQTTRDAARAASAGSALWASTCRHAMLDHARRRAAEEGLDQRDVRAGRRADPPLRRRRRSTSPSAAPPRCSSATTSPRSPTSAEPCARADGWCW